LEVTQVVVFADVEEIHFDVARFRHDIAVNAL
jgi:hypothetical protein